MRYFRTWLGQVTTGHGFMILASTVMAAMTGQMPWSIAAPMLAASVTGMLWPENKALVTDVQALTNDAEGLFTARKLTVMLLAGGLAAMGLAACTPAIDAKVQKVMATPAGRLFCAIQTGGGGTLVANVIDAKASELTPLLSPVFVLATGATKQAVDDDCAKAAVAANGVAGNPVSPPPDPATVVATVAVMAPSSPTAATN